MMDETILREALIETRKYLISQFEEPTDEEIQFSWGFRRRMKKLIDKYDHPAWYYGRKIAALVFLVIGLTGGLILEFNETARAQVQKWFFERFSRNEFIYKNAVDENKHLAEYSLVEAVPAEYMLIDSQRDEETITEIYVNAEGNILSFFAFSSGYGGSVYVLSDEDRIGEPCYVDEILADIYISKDTNDSNEIVWHGKDDTLFIIQGMFTKEELIGMAGKILR